MVNPENVPTVEELVPYSLGPLKSGEENADSVLYSRITDGGVRASHQAFTCNPLGPGLMAARSLFFLGPRMRQDRCRGREVLIRYSVSPRRHRVHRWNGGLGLFIIADACQFYLTFLLRDNGADLHP